MRGDELEITRLKRQRFVAGLRGAAERKSPLVVIADIRKNDVGTNVCFYSATDLVMRAALEKAGCKSIKAAGGYSEVWHLSSGKAIAATIDIALAKTLIGGTISTKDIALEQYSAQLDKECETLGQFIWQVGGHGFERHCANTSEFIEYNFLAECSLSIRDMLTECGFKRCDVDNKSLSRERWRVANTRANQFLCEGLEIELTRQLGLSPQIRTP